MKKLYFAAIAAMVLAGGIFVACNKDETEQQNLEKEATNKATMVILGRQIASVIGSVLMNSLDLQVGSKYLVTYSSGYYYERTRESKILGGLIYSETEKEKGCNPGSGICQITGIRQIGAFVGTGKKVQDTTKVFVENPDGTIGLNIEDLGIEDMHDGIIMLFKEGIFSKNRVLCFLTDVSKMERFKDLNSYLNTDVFEIKTAFPLNAELAYGLGILPENQFIASGNYAMVSKDNIRIWFVELDNWIGKEE